MRSRLSFFYLFLRGTNDIFKLLFVFNVHALEITYWRIKLSLIGLRFLRKWCGKTAIRF